MVASHQLVVRFLHFGKISPIFGKAISVPLQNGEIIRCWCNLTLFQVGCVCTSPRTADYKYWRTYGGSSPSTAILHHQRFSGHPNGALCSMNGLWWPITSIFHPKSHDIRHNRNKRVVDILLLLINKSQAWTSNMGTPVLTAQQYI